MDTAIFGLILKIIIIILHNLYSAHSLRSTLQCIRGQHNYNTIKNVKSQTWNKRDKNEGQRNVVFLHLDFYFQSLVT